eukprot:NODE_3443_length_2035_cov_6.303983.p1 GENE.NODE_3443_length_2035_cov_6.303983~~NODE_3443_length_2035_cov_6.303983.p1  ORF type:complete len:539 (-),score=151.43 NODE_3443_length_2035_cov_6.303983:308-1924(-)
MGNHAAHHQLECVTTRSKSRMGTLAVTGRYHRLPKKLSDDYEIQDKVLGSGYNGQVHMAMSTHNRQAYAVKEFKLHGASKAKRLELESEVEIALAMDHPHVARLVDVYESDDVLSLVMECMTGGELFDRIKKLRRFHHSEAAGAAEQMLLAINYIHAQNIVHRDLKLENFLYESADTNYLKLIDFGFSKIWAPNTKMALSCGTLSYVAPEVLCRSYTNKCDMWSFGVIVFTLLLGSLPFKGSDEESMIRSIKAGDYVIRPNIISAEAKDFIERLLIVDANQRLSAEQALAHTWIKDRQSARMGDHVNNDVIDALAEFGQASQFRRACMELCAWSLTAEDRAQVREAFLEIDTDHSGAITLGEFKQCLEGKFHLSDDDAIRAFQALDTNHSEKIHYSDFLAAMVSSRIKLHDDLLKETFRRFDADNSGFIDAANLKEILGDTIPGAEIEELIKSYDGRISYAGWLEYLRNGDVLEGHSTAAASIIDSQLKVRVSGRATRMEAKKVGDNAANPASQNEAEPGPANKAQSKPSSQRCCAIM